MDSTLAALLKVILVETVRRGRHVRSVPSIISACCTSRSRTKLLKKGSLRMKWSACASATLHQETSACTGAGGNCVLAIVPIRVKSKKSNKTVEAYAFMDPGSSASFCTEALAKQLNVQGRKANLMVSTINSRS